jgi:hypothetical protein
VGIFGQSARVRDKALAEMQPYAPAYVGGSGSRGVMAPPVPDAAELYQPQAASPPPVNMGPALALPSNMFAAKIKPHFFDKTGTGTKLVQLLGDLSTQWGAAQGQPWALQQLQTQQRNAEAEREQVIWSRRHDLQRSEALEDAERTRNAPRYFSGREDQLSFDPSTGKVATIYDAPTDAESYAKSLGFDAGSPEYRGALTDYVLKANGPTAEAARESLLGQRQQGSTNLEALRQRNRIALKRTPSGNGHGHSGPTIGSLPRTTGNVYAPILAKVARGEALSPGEQRVLDMRGGHGRGGAASGPRTATDPRTGKKVQWNGSAWVPAN